MTPEAQPEPQVIITEEDYERAMGFVRSGESGVYEEFVIRKYVQALTGAAARWQTACFKDEGDEP